VNRHHRQQLLPQIGPAGQRRLREAHALVVGLGALGSVIAESLARAGVGTLTLIDRDVVERTNLQRQTLYIEANADADAPKPLAAKARLAQIDSSLTIHAVCDDFSPATAPALVGFDWDTDDDDIPPLSPSDGERARVRGSTEAPNLLLDGTDNFETRYLLNDIAVSQSIPYIHAGVVGTAGSVMTIDPPRTPCLRCLFPNLPPPGAEPTCDTAGVLGPAAGAVASLAAAEAIKLLSGNAQDANPSLIHLDAWAPALRAVDVSDAKRDDCPCCARRRFDFLDAAAGEITSLCGRRSVQIAPAARGALDLDRLAARLAPHGDFTRENQTLTGAFTTESGEHGPITLHVFQTGRAIIGGTTNTGRAKSIYSQFVGW